MKMAETTPSSGREAGLGLEVARSRRIPKRLRKSAAKLWLAAGGLLGVSLLPCPECGTPLIFHVWPLAGLVLLARAIRKHAQGKELMDPDGMPQNPETSFKKLD